MLLALCTGLFEEIVCLHHAHVYMVDALFACCHWLNIR